MTESQNENPKEIVRKLVSEHIKAKPKRISLKLDWDGKSSLIRLIGDDLDQRVEYQRTIDFTSFAHGVIEAYEETYGKLEVVPVSFREDVYRNDKVSLDLYPTGMAGIFDIFIEYKQPNSA